MVENKSVTYVNCNTPLSITSKDINLDTCFTDKEIVVEVHSAALNPIDALLYSFSAGPISGSAPKVYGKDYSGIVVKSGKSVKDFKVGDQVNGMYVETLTRNQGSLTHYLVFDPILQPAISNIHQAGEASSDVFNMHAAWPLVFGTAYSLLYNYGQKLGPDSKILVLGASTCVGNAVVRIAKEELKVGTVVGTCSSTSVEYNKKFGFDYLIPYNDPKLSAPHYAVDLVNNTFNGEKFDLIADCCGGNTFFPVTSKILKCKNNNGYYITIVGDNKIDYRSPSFLEFLNFRTFFRVVNPFRGYNYAMVMLQPHNNYMKLGSKMIEEGTYTPPIDSVYKFEQFQEAVDRLTSCKAKGKVVVSIQ